MSGANYNISVTEIMESEKKLRILSVMKLVQHNNGAMTVRDFTAGCRAEAEAADNELDTDVNVSQFSSVLQEVTTSVFQTRLPTAVVTPTVALDALPTPCIRCP